ncbi:protein arginine kinase activator [Virgibacillus natechei]|uniref:Protein arginine kinase activator n=1 Tax=Virgibacillus natechei TaxID=1216297 RepID=A0ABS4IJT3_9BACI|nr:UvrB/UvrC motif-containing protein [Virgibacillus natechei]MBP1970835.1 protein arginine kinase activator [Virgibacillus natechei]UZD13221.1 UvrB/UvrC motif-containing protein [Virgibacillus natechei]
MECQECQQRPATFHFTQVINGDKKEVHVCEECAMEKGYMTSPEEGYSLHNLLAGLFNFDSAIMESKQSNAYKQENELKCSHCEMTLSQFKQLGKFGCAACYDTFSGRLDPIFRRVHSGNTQHYGKIPKRQGGNLHTKKQLESYRTELQKLIGEENFEEAAKVRDQIRALEQENGNTEAGDNS